MNKRANPILKVIVEDLLKAASITSFVTDLIQSASVHLAALSQNLAQVSAVKWFSDETMQLAVQALMAS